MALVSVGSGTNACDGSEQTIDTETAPKTYVLQIGLEDMANGEELIVRIKTKVLTGDTAAVAYTGNFANVQGDPVAYSIPVPSLFQLIVTFEGTNTMNVRWNLMTVD